MGCSLSRHSRRGSRPWRVTQGCGSRSLMLLLCLALCCRQVAMYKADPINKPQTSAAREFLQVGPGQPHELPRTNWGAALLAQACLTCAPTVMYARTRAHTRTAHHAHMCACARRSDLASPPPPSPRPSAPGWRDPMSLPLLRRARRARCARACPRPPAPPSSCHRSSGTTRMRRPRRNWLTQSSPR